MLIINCKFIDARIDECTCEQNVSVFLVAKRPSKHTNFSTQNRVDHIARIVFPISVCYHLIFVASQIFFSVKHHLPQ